MIQEEAVRKIADSLKQDELVQAIFLKGSMGRGEHDEYSDIDLYCLVDEIDEEKFLANRLEHIQSYRKVLFHEDVFIIAPQIIAVFDNLLHLDLFTVTEKSFKEKDFFRVLYDPRGLLEKFKETQNLTLSQDEFYDDVYDIAWFLFRYKKTVARGNDLWAVEMLRHVMLHLSRVLLHRYAPNRAQLGLKEIEASLPKHVLVKVTAVFQKNTPESHGEASNHITEIVAKEMDWILSHVDESQDAGPFLEKMVAIYTGKESLIK